MMNLPHKRGTRRSDDMPKPSSSESLQSSVLEHLSAGVVVYAPDSRVIYANQTACQLLGLSRGKAAGEWVDDPGRSLVRDDGAPLPATEHPVVRVLAGDEPVLDLAMGVDRPESGDRVWLLASAIPEHSPDGALLHVVMTVTDITGRQKAEARGAGGSEAGQEQRAEAITQVVRGLAHDFNNVLMVQKGYCELMHLQLQDDDPLAESLVQIETHVDRGIGLVRELQSFIRKEALRPEVLDFNYVLEERAKTLETLVGEGIEVATVFAAHPATVMADRAQMEQMLVGLVGGARDAMTRDGTRGGTLTIGVSWTDVDDGSDVKDLDIEAGPYVRLAVGGTGLNGEAARKMLEPSTAGEGGQGGSGPGLATVREAVRQSGGALRIEEKADGRAEFAVYLPRVELSGARPADEREQTGEQRKSILIVEDEAALRGLVVMMLEKLGYETREAGTSADALRMVEDEGLVPDLMLTDLVLPGLSGSALAERLCGRLPGLKLIYMSGYADQAVLASGAADSSVDFLRKPFTMSDLEAKVVSALGPAKS
jgi:two-component system cell cycle sensor histidine kinase/response regulator CckA